MVEFKYHGAVLCKYVHTMGALRENKEGGEECGTNMK